MIGFWLFIFGSHVLGQPLQGEQSGALMSLYAGLGSSLVDINAVAHGGFFVVCFVFGSFGAGCKGNATACPLDCASADSDWKFKCNGGKVTHLCEVDVCFRSTSQIAAQELGQQSTYWFNFL